MNTKIFSGIASHQLNLILFISILSFSCTTEELVIVAREAASVGSYPIVGTSQTKSWDSAGNIINPVLGEAFYGQDAQYVHTTPAYTQSSDGLTVKDEITGLTWQKSYDSGTYYWGASQAVANNLNKKNTVDTATGVCQPLRSYTLCGM